MLTLLLMIASVTFAEAQQCGKWKIEVEVQTTAGEPLKNAVVELLPITTDERRGKQFVNSAKSRSKFSIEFLEGHSIKNFHKLLVTAKGHKPAEQEIRAISCSGKKISVSLPIEDVEITPIWEFDNNITFSTDDSNGNPIRGVTLNIIFDGEGFGTAFFEQYGHSLSLPSGKYIFRFEKEGYELQEIEVDATKISDINISVGLKGNTTKQNKK